MSIARTLRNSRAALLIFFLALLPAGYWFWQARHLEHLGYFHDDGMYLLGAKTLAETGQYRIPNLPEAPAQTKYPPLFPLLLSLVWRWGPPFPENLPWMMLATWLMLPLNAWLMARLLESWGCSRTRALYVSAWVVMNPYIVFFGVTLMSELMVSCLIAGCLLAAQGAANRRRAALAGLLAAAAYLTKTAALPMLAALPLWFAWKGRRREALAAALPCVLAFAGWNAWSALHRFPPRDVVEIYYLSYLGDFFYDFRWADLPVIVWQNLATFLASAGNLLVADSIDFPVLGANLPRLIGIFAVVGAIRHARTHGMELVHWFAAGYMALTILWIYPPNERFLIPLAPLIAFGAQAELTHLVGQMRAAWRLGKPDLRVAVGIFSVVFVAGALWAFAMLATGQVITLPATFSRASQQAADYQQAYAWIRANVPPGERFMTHYDASLFLSTGHFASRPPTFPKLAYRKDVQVLKAEMARLAHFARQRGIRYWLDGDIGPNYDPFLHAAVDLRKLTVAPPYTLVFEAPMVRLYRID